MKIVIKNIQAILPDGAGSNKIEQASVVINQGVIESVLTGVSPTFKPDFAST